MAHRFSRASVGAALALVGCNTGTAQPVTDAGPKPKGSGEIVLARPASTSKATADLPKIPALEAPHVGADKPVLDGVLDDACWKAAADTGAFVDVSTGMKNPGLPVQGSAKLAWDDEALYVAWQVADQKVHGGFPAGAVDPHLWERDTVELMVDPDGDGDNRDYYEIQINPQNLVFDSRFDSYNQPVDSKAGSFGHMDWSAKLTSAVKVDGTLEADADLDKGYVVEARVPWSSFDKAKQAPPKSGDTWRVNLYAMKDNGGVAWSAIARQGNFHKASRFGRVTFTKK